MNNIISTDLIKQTINFHGHQCPGLAIGIKASEIALKEIGHHSQDEEIVAVTETDMCGVDAISFLTGCTFGKGNLFFFDYGKMAFSFYNRDTGKKIRLVYSPNFTSTLEDKIARSEEILQKNAYDLFKIEEPPYALPCKARLHDSIICTKCDEKTMETRCRIFMGKHYCIPCFEKEEKRIDL